MSEAIRTQAIVDAFTMLPEHREALLFVRELDTFFLYNEMLGYFEMYDAQHFEEKVYKYTKETVDKNISKNLIRDIIYQVKMSCFNKITRMETTYIALKDQLLNLETFLFEPFDIASQTFHRLPVESVALKQPIPLFQKFLDEVLVDDNFNPDRQLQTVLQEMFGFYLLNELRPHTVFFLVGSGANGKSVVLNILIELIGKEYISAMPIQTLTTNQFSLSGLIGKKLNVCNEEESKYMESAKFKALVSGDPVTAERKFGDAFVFVPATKYVFASNNPPTFDALNEGIRRRMKIIPFKRVIPSEQQDYNLFTKLKTELGGITGWALEGAKRLIKNNYVFSTSDAMKETTTEFENTTSSALMFIRENYDNDPNSFVSNTDMYRFYSFWCEANGRKRMNSANFFKDLQHVFQNKSAAKWNVELKIAERGRNLKLKPGIVPAGLI